jgi:hypothetical protein
MGGLVFGNKHVPRMSPQLYQRLSAEYRSKLEILFEKVVIPREAPAKADHGDIDYLVEGIKSPSSSSDDIWFTIKDHLAADLHIARGGSHSYGIPHPELPDAYVQIDVELSPGNGTPDGPILFEWTRYMKGDSDLLQILGVAHRPLGIMCNDQGLHVRLSDSLLAIPTRQWNSTAWIPPSTGPASRMKLTCSSGQRAAASFLLRYLNVE